MPILCVWENFVIKVHIFYVKNLSKLTSNFRIIFTLFVVDSETPADGESISIYNIKYPYIY